MSLPKPNPAAPRTTMENERRKAELKYRRSLDRILRMVTKALEGVTDPRRINAAIDKVVKSPQFDAMCVEAARQVATILFAGEHKTWRQAAAASTQGRIIYEALAKETAANTPLGQAIADIVQRNSLLIKTCPHDIASKLSSLAQQRWTEGKRPEEIMEEVLEKAPHLREFEARRIARTEAAKASTALIQARSESLGLEFYEWYTAKDERVRPSHAKMQGVICRWSDPPSPEALNGEKSAGNYPPGGIYNCRCIACPIIRLEDIEFPAKFHFNGKIERIGSLKALRDRLGAS